MRSVVALLCLLLAGTASAGVGQDSYRKWMPLTDDLWTAGDADEEIHAVVLYSGHIVDDSSKKGNCRHHVYKRILLRDQAGVDEFSTIEIQLTDDEDIADLKARTVKRDGTVLELSDEDFHEKTLIEYGKDRIEARAFAFKGADPGDIVEYRYVRKMKADAPPLVHLRGYYPTEVAEVTWFFQALPELDPRSRWEYAQYLWEPVYILGNGRPYLTQEEAFPNVEKPEGLFLRLEKLPALARESYAPSFGERTTSFVGHYRFPNRDEEQDYWNRASADVGKYVNDFVKKSSGLDPWFTSVENEPRDLDADLARCFAFIDENLRCERFLPARERTLDIESSDNVNELLERKVATAYDIDRLLVAMLDRLGYEATVFWLRDRTEGPFVREWKTFGQFTLSGVAVLDGDEIRWCYPSAGRGRPDGLPWEFIGCTALLGQRSAEDETDPFPVFEVIPVPPSEGNRLDLEVSLTPDEDLVARGRLRHEWSCRNEVHWVSYLASLEEDERLDELRSLVLPEGVVWTGHDERSEIDGFTVAFSCSLEVEGIVDEAGDLLLVDLSRLRADDFDVDAEERQSDVYFHFPVHCRTMVNVQCPEGFVTDGAPPSQRKEESFARMQMQSLRAERAYRMVRDVEIPHCMYYKEAAQPMKDFLTQSYEPAKNPVVFARSPGEQQ